MIAPERVLVACVAENRDPWRYEAELLFRSLRRFGGSLARAQGVAYFVGGADAGVVERLAALGVRTKIVEPVNPGCPHANKIRMLDDAEDYEYLVALDTDIVVARDFAPLIPGSTVAAKPVDSDPLASQQWEALFGHFGLPVPPVRYLTAFDLDETLPYFNSGVLIVPKPYVPALRERWEELVARLLEAYPDLPDVAPHSFFTDQFAFALALADLGLPHRALPLEMNFPTHYRVHAAWLPERLSPYLIHYHHKLSPAGEVLPCAYPGINEVIAAVNREVAGGCPPPAAADGAPGSVAAVGSTATPTRAGAGDRRYRVSIVMSVLNQAESVRRCLESLAAHTPDDLYELVVVDNGSTDGTRELLACLEGDVQVIANREDPGFARACNQGAAAANGEYLLFLSSNADVLPGWLEPLVAALDRETDVGCALLVPDGAPSRPGVTEVGRRDGGVAAALFRREAFFEAGGFDGGHHDGYEDAGQCSRLRERGWRVVHETTDGMARREPGEVAARRMEEALATFEAALTKLDGPTGCNLSAEVTAELEAALAKLEQGFLRGDTATAAGFAGRLEAGLTRLEEAVVRLEEALPEADPAGTACPPHLRLLQRAYRFAVEAPVIADRWAWRRVGRVRERFAVRYGGRRFTTTFDGSVRLRVSLADHIESQVFWQGVQEADRGQVRLIKRLLRPGHVFIDVGANVGVFSLMAAGRVPGGEVHAFEPSADHSARLRENLEINEARNVVQNQAALARAAGEVTLYVPKTANTGMASLYRGAGDGVEHDTETVRATTLDAYARERGLRRIDLVKIDVEGSELDVLEGGAETLRAYRPDLTMEVDREYLERAGRSVDELLAFLHGLGYSVYRIELNGALERVEAPGGLRAHQNIYCHADPR